MTPTVHGHSPIAPPGTHQPHPLEARLLTLFESNGHHGLDDRTFDALALEVFRYQFSCNPPYQRFCLSRGATLESVMAAGRWESVPAIPSEAFKAAHLATFPVTRAVRTFRTSGTTQGARGAHAFVTMDLYEAAILPAFRRFLLPDSAKLPVLSLVPPPEDTPDSSLSYMVGYLASRQEVSGGHADFFLTRDGLEVDRLERALHDAASSGHPVMILTTALALAHLLERRPDLRARLPRGSRMMYTGGMKGSHRALPYREFLEIVERSLGIPPTHCVAEYGMTELSSQMYETVLRDTSVGGDLSGGVPAHAAGSEGSAHHPGAGDRANASRGDVSKTRTGEAPSGPREAATRRLEGPPWLRWLVVDPATEAPQPPGRPGLVRLFDLANLYSVAAIQTSDIGVADDGGLILLGRVAGAQPRGCSLTAAEILENGSGRHGA